MEVRYSREAQKALLRSNKRDLLLEKIGLLASDPESLRANVIQLAGRPEFRLRVQDWRVLFLREGDTLLIRDIAPRGRAYEVWR